MTTLLIDADIFAFQSALLNQETYDWGEGVSGVWVGEEQAKAHVDHSLEKLQDELKAKHVVIALSDPTRDYFRKDILPSYKANRAGSQPPEALELVKSYLEENYKTYRKPRLEGDDVLGILLTHPKLIKGEKVCVSMDKDMKTVPGLHYNPDKDDEVRRYCKGEANQFWMMQTLMGDTTDGYKGCPRIGPKKAEAILEECANLKQMWTAVVETYESKGLTEADALIQARCARILRHTDYDYKRGEVKLWQPPEL